MARIQHHGRRSPRPGLYGVQSTPDRVAAARSTSTPKKPVDAYRLIAKYGHQARIE